MNNIKLINVTFPVNGNNHCCFAEYGGWVDTKTTKVGEGEDKEELFLGTVLVGEVIDHDLLRLFRPKYFFVFVQ